MPLSPDQAVEQVEQMREWRNGEMHRLDTIHDYIRDEQKLDWLPSGVPTEVERIARMARVNVLPFVVDTSVQALYLDGYRTRSGPDDEPAWSIWQRNGMDARQVGLHRSALTYGASYTVVLPGEPVASIRGVSARNMTTVYGPDDEWPMWALERRRTTGGELWRLFDDEAVYWVGTEERSDRLVWITTELHDAGVCPVVRYRSTVDLDDDVRGDVWPLLRLQDQINMTTFGLLVAQHYGAHRQRYIIGWLAESEEAALKASAQKLWTFDDDPESVKVGEFEQTELEGYIDSREASLRHVATVSQTPVHELLGTMANLAADALAAARDSHNRKLAEREVVLGESHEQTLGLAAGYEALEVDPAAWVRWRDMEARSLSQTADALGKLVEMLGIPRQAMWEKVPGVSQDEVERWKAMASEDDSIGQLAELLDRQMASG